MTAFQAISVHNSSNAVRCLKPCTEVDVKQQQLLVLSVHVYHVPLVGFCFICSNAMQQKRPVGVVHFFMQ